MTTIIGHPAGRVYSELIHSDLLQGRSDGEGIGTMWMSMIEASARSAMELLIAAVRLLEESKNSGLGTDYIEDLSTDILLMEKEVVSLLGGNYDSGEVTGLFNKVYAAEMTIDDFISRTLLETA